MARMLQMHYSKLHIWQKAMDLAHLAYQLTEQFPKVELYGLTAQIKRAAVSIPSNIAEGSQRSSNRDFANFVLIAKGSLAELETQFALADLLKYVDAARLQALKADADELHRMLHAFHSKLSTRNS